MVKALSLADAIRAVSGELQLRPLSPVRLNHAAARIDHLGRRLHGQGWVRDHEIGGCLTAAVWELSQAVGLPEVDGEELVRQAILQLEAALTHSEEGLRPQDP